MKDFYNALRVFPNATQAEIKSQYRKIVKEIGLDALIGDLNKAKGRKIKSLIQALEAKVANAEEAAKQLNEAYETLSDNNKKSKYDREYFKNKPPLVVLSHSSLDFGQLKKGETKTLSFEVKNIGGPANSIIIQWASNPSWAAQSRYSSQFPIKVTVKASNSGGLDGMQMATLNIVINGQTKSISISFFAVASETKVEAFQKPYNTLHNAPEKTEKDSTNQPEHESKPHISQKRYEELQNKPPIQKTPKRSINKLSTLIAGIAILFGCIVFFALSGVIYIHTIQTTNEEYRTQAQQLLSNPPITINTIRGVCPLGISPNGKCYWKILGTLDVSNLYPSDIMLITINNPTKYEIYPYFTANGGYVICNEKERSLAGGSLPTGTHVFACTVPNSIRTPSVNLCVEFEYRPNYDEPVYKEIYGKKFTICNIV